MLGRYIDALPEVARERVIRARSWTLLGYVDPPSGARSLLGHAEDWCWDTEADTTRCRAPYLLPLRETVGDTWLNWPPMIDVRYDHLVDRVGAERAARLLQTRAARRCGAAGFDQRRCQAGSGGVD